MSLKCRLIQETGTRAFLRVYWGHHEDCKDAWGPGKHGIHNAMKHLMDMDKLGDWEVGGSPKDYPREEWPTHCEHCGEPVPTEGASYQVFHRRLYNTTSGRPESGDMYYAPWYHEPEHKKHYCRWDNCDDPRGHLIVVLPTGHEWDLDSRASNCTLKEDRIHRCWVRHGEPPDIHIDKNGHTCAAGAGSILVPGYHGFLHHGYLTDNL